MKEVPTTSLSRFGRTPLDRFPRFKTRLALRFQDQVLGVIDRLPVDSFRSRAFRHGLRRLVGGVLWSVKLEVNNACDLSCRMCYASKGSELLPLPAIKRLLDDIKGAGTRIEILGGEPLLRADLADIILYAKRKARIPKMVVYTNARYADRTRARELHRAGLDIAIVNLISCDEGEHDAFVGMNGAWRQTVNGIEQLIGAGVEVYTFTAVHSLNITGLRRSTRSSRKGLTPTPCSINTSRSSGTTPSSLTGRAGPRSNAGSFVR